jgi:hypothetical protein
MLGLVLGSQLAFGGEASLVGGGDDEVFLLMPFRENKEQADKESMATITIASTNGRLATYCRGMIGLCDRLGS